MNHQARDRGSFNDSHVKCEHVGKKNSQSLHPWPLISILFSSFYHHFIGKCVVIVAVWCWEPCNCMQRCRFYAQGLRVAMETGIWTTKVMIYQNSLRCIGWIPEALRGGSGYNECPVGQERIVCRSQTQRLLKNWPLETRGVEELKWRQQPGSCGLCSSQCSSKLVELCQQCEFRAIIGAKSVTTFRVWAGSGAVTQVNWNHYDLLGPALLK